MNRFILGAIIGAVLFGLFWIPLGLNLWLSLGLGFGAFVASSFAFKKSPGEPNQQTSTSRDTVLLAKKYEDSIRALAKSIKHSATSETLDKLALLTKKIKEDVASDPKDASSAQRFLNYYADVVLKLGEGYKTLDQRGIRTPTIDEARSRIETNLQKLVSVFTAHLGRLQEDNLLDIDTELTVLEQTINAEGFNEVK